MLGPLSLLGTKHLLLSTCDGNCTLMTNFYAEKQNTLARFQVHFLTPCMYMDVFITISDVMEWKVSRIHRDMKSRCTDTS